MLRYRDFIENQTSTKSTTTTKKRIAKIIATTLKTTIRTTLKTPLRTTLRTTVSPSTSSPLFSDFSTITPPLLNAYNSTSFTGINGTFPLKNETATTTASELSKLTAYEFLQLILLSLLIVLVLIILLWLCACTKKFLIFPKPKRTFRDINQMPSARNPFYDGKTAKSSNDQMLGELPRLKSNESDSLRTTKCSNGRNIFIDGNDVHKTNIDNMFEKLPLQKISRSDSSRTIKCNNTDFISFKK